MKLGSIRWLLRPGRRWSHLRQAPLRQLTPLFVAVFLLFSVIGFYNDLMAGGVMPYAVVLTLAAYTGLNSALWVIVVARLPVYWLFLMVGKELFIPTSTYLTVWAQRAYHQPQVAPEAGLHFAAISILIAVIASYICFSMYMGTLGRQTYRLRAELDLAQGIQKTLVPVIHLKTRCFEVYGVSHPSEKVGGDLVDVVDIADGNTVAYLADIAGHGLPAGILMGMLKTAVRTALTETQLEHGRETLSRLMARLNHVLPQVKESHMYATFSGLRLDFDGQASLGMAASTPILHWSALSQSIHRIEDEQFPLGLLPVPEFPARELAMAEGDLVVIATDGILEVEAVKGSEAKGAEFGVARLEGIVADHAQDPLPELAAIILHAARSFGKQQDDQTLLLIRRTLA
jgi:serine phosphatase RsbU (regulator of sigma subunit)